MSAKRSPIRPGLGPRPKSTTASAAAHSAAAAPRASATSWITPRRGRRIIEQWGVPLMGHDDDVRFAAPGKHRVVEHEPCDRGRPRVRRINARMPPMRSRRTWPGRSERRQDGREVGEIGAKPEIRGSSVVFGSAVAAIVERHHPPCFYRLRRQGGCQRMKIGCSPGETRQAYDRKRRWGARPIHADMEQQVIGSRNEDADEILVRLAVCG